MNYAAFENPSSIEPIDLDGDGLTDLLGFDSRSTTATALMGLPGGGFNPVTFPVGGYPYALGAALFAGHFDGPAADGGTALPDLAVIRIDTPVIQLLQSQGGLDYE